jgi:HPt (histidine-containing phosphotransfer) domain-containing protein
VGLYRDTLAAFARHATNLITWLPEALNQQEWGDLVREAHTLKGLAGTIGCTSLVDQAEAMESMAADHDGPSTRGAIEEVSRSLSRLLSNLAREIEPTDADPAKGLIKHEPSSRDLDLAQRLKQLAAECDSEALALWRRHRQDFMAWLPAVTATRLHTSLERCDFDSAFSLLDELDLEMRAS